MADNQGHDVPNVAILNVTDITNEKHLRLPDNDKRESNWINSDYFKLGALIRRNRNT